MIVVDIETSGLDFYRCGIWQIGALDFYNPRNQFIQDGRIDDEDIVQPKALEITGKTEEELRDRNKQPQKQLIENLFDWSRSCRVINLGCENPQFDLSFISVKSEKYKLKFPFPHRAFDLHSTAQDRYFLVYKEFLLKDGKSDLGLSNILEFVGIPDNRGAHTALEDAKLEAEAFLRLYERRNMFSEYTQFPIPYYLK